MFRVIGTATYLEELDKLPKAYKDAAGKIPLRLAENAHLGKPFGYPFLREQRINEKRIYYLIYDDLQLVLMVAVSGKKDQQATISHIKNQLYEYLKIAEDISKQAF